MHPGGRTSEPKSKGGSYLVMLKESKVSVGGWNEQKGRLWELRSER